MDSVQQRCSQGPIFEASACSWDLSSRWCGLSGRTAGPWPTSGRRTGGQEGLAGTAPRCPARRVAQPGKEEAVAAGRARRPSAQRPRPRGRKWQQQGQGGPGGGRRRPGCWARTSVCPLGQDLHVPIGPKDLDSEWPELGGDRAPLSSKCRRCPGPDGWGTRPRTCPGTGRAQVGLEEEAVGGTVRTGG